MNIKLLLLVVAGAFSFTSALAQNTYPNRPIQMIMPLQAGSGVDILMRPIVQKMGKTWGKPSPSKIFLVGRA